MFWANRSMLLNDIFDPSMPCLLLIQGAFKDGGRGAAEAEVLLPTGPDPSVCAAQIFQQLPTTIAAPGRCEDAGWV